MNDGDKFIYAMLYKPCSSDDLYDDIYDELLCGDSDPTSWVVRHDLWIADRQEVLFKGDKIRFNYGKWFKVT